MAKAAADTAGPVKGVTRTSALTPVATWLLSQPPASSSRAAAQRARAIRGGRPGRNSAATARSRAGRPISRASRSAHGTAESGAEHRKAGEAAAGREAQRLAQGLLPERCGVKAQRQAGVREHGAGTVQGGDQERHEQGKAGQQRPPHGAAAAAQERAAQCHEDDGGQQQRGGCRGHDGQRQAGRGGGGPGGRAVDPGLGRGRFGEAPFPGGRNGVAAAARGGAGGPQQGQHQQRHHDVGDAGLRRGPG